MADWSDLRTRTISGIALVVGVLFITWVHAYAFAALTLVGAVILWREWRGLTRTRSPLFIPFGAIYIGGAVAGLIYLRFESLPILLSLFAIVWTGDIAAYLVGKKFGCHKIAPAISPGKSWEGLAGSVVASAAIAAALGSMAPIPHAILGAVLACIGLAGDMFESALKRRVGVKDSGTLIPGHGGLFDRVDALLPCAIVAALALAVRLGMQ